MVLRPHHFSAVSKRIIPPAFTRPLSTSPRFFKMADHKNENNKRSRGDEPHQYQASSRTDREEDQWKFRAPYKIHDKGENFDVKWKGKCHCGAVQYELSREKPLASKYCHCTTCQRMHGVCPHQRTTCRRGYSD